MKKIAFIFLFVSSLFTACQNRDENGSTDTSNTNSSKSITDSTRGDKPPADEAVSVENINQSSTFVAKAASGGMLEVQLGQLAAQKATSLRVKDFGKMMITDHSKANDDLKGLAAAQNIVINSVLLPEHQSHLDMMSKLSGDEFDKHYIRMMVEDHNEDINEFEKEAGNLKENKFKEFAAKALPILRKHLDSARAIQNAQ